MKTYRVLILLIVTLIYEGISYSGENDFLPDLKLFSKECDLCGCYLGFQANYSRNQVGIRYRFREFVDNSSNSRELFNTFELYGRYYVTPRVQLLVSMPYAFNKAEGENFKGIGDILILTQYRLIMPSYDIKSINKLRSSLYIGGGLKFPTGTYSQKLPDGSVEAHYQTGTGSTDFILTGTYIGLYKDFGMASDVVYRFGTFSPINYKFANRFNTSVTFFYQAALSHWTVFTPNTGIYFESSPRDNNSVSTFEGNSGGTIMFLTTGLNYSHNYISFDATYQMPLYQNLFGSQPQNKMRVIFSSCYMF